MRNTAMRIASANVIIFYFDNDIIHKPCRSTIYNAKSFPNQQWQKFYPTPAS